MVKLTAEEADMVALAPIRERHFSVGRRHTRLTIAGRSLSEPKSILLKGNYEPEAFSTDRKSLFVIRFLPARAPTRYQVRRLDIEEGRVHAVYTPDADLQESMGGTARIQTASPDGSRLYTLYTTGTGNDRYAFIHVLSLDEIWAHCIDLPPEFAKHADTATSISVSPDGRRLYVVNAAAGMMAEVDTSTLEVVKTAPIDFVVAAHVHSAVDDSGSTVFFTSGNSVAAVNTMDLTVRASWEMDQKVQGVQVAVDGARVYVGLVDRIVVLDAASGKQLESIDPPGIKRIQEFGPVIRSIDQAGIVCAC
jgi:DNA-binding beta-propeller fold protein YncE